MVTLADIEAARKTIDGSVFVSPCAYSETFSRLTGNKVFFKLENLQMTGSFKERGAVNKLMSLTAEERQRGVVTASAGNHAQGVAYHATRLGIRSTIVMPVGTPLIKVSSTRNFGGEVVLYGTNFDEACEEAERLRRSENLVFVHAFDDDAIIAGQGTIGLELLEQEWDLEAIVVPVGGGGMIGGIACAVKELRPEIKVVGVETARVPSMIRAVEGHAPVTLPPASTIGDGIAVRRAGDRTLPLVERYVDEIVTVDEEEIANAILLLLEREKTVAEGAGAVGAAALLNHKTSLKGLRTAVVISGGNIDVNFLSRIIERGLVKDGRLVRLRLRALDQPATLHKVLGLIAEKRANVMDIVHDRAHYGVHLGETVIDLTLETRGRPHADEIVAALVAGGYPIEQIG